jgi:pseudaminic acid synthase
MRIGSHQIGLKHQPFIIAEMSGNHNCSIERAIAIVDAAADAGAHAIKLQTYTADTMTLDIKQSGFLIENAASLWAGKSLYDLYNEAHLPWEWHSVLMKRAAQRGLVCFSTPFDATSVDFLEELGVPAYKIASFENTDLGLIRKVAATRKPLIVSTGMASIEELDILVRTAKSAGCKDLVLLKCTSSYPATPENTNLLTIPHLRQMFDTEVGLSDHTLGVGVAVASVALGASVIEKHFTLSRDDGGVDAAFSLEVAEMRMLVEESKRAHEALGRISYGPSDAESHSLQFRRSLYIVRDVQQGENLSELNVRAIRPGFGLSPRYLDLVIGRPAKRALKRGHPLSLEDILNG